MGDRMADDNGNIMEMDFRSLGQSGLKRYAGYVREDILLELTGKSGIQTFREMGDNDPVCSAILYAIDRLCRQVTWSVKPASREPVDQEAADFITQCMDDMEMPWIDVMSEFLTMMQYGFSAHEIVYKRRCGTTMDDPSYYSKYADGRIGWRSLPMRSQDTILKWVFDTNGKTVGYVQLAPPDFREVYIPMEKALLFRTSVFKDNPEGRSIFRGAYRPWYFKKKIENIEAVGIERDLAGLPVAKVPPQILSSKASAGEKALLDTIKNIVTNIRRDEEEGVVWPLAYDDNGNELYKLELLSSGGSRNFDTDKIINRYDQRIAMTCLFDFMMLGQGPNASGSWAMHSDKTKLAAMAVGASLDIIAETINRYAIPRLMALNDFAISEHPCLQHGDLESVDLVELGDYITKLAGAGMPLFPDKQLESHLRKSAHLPDVVDEKVDEDQEVEVPEAMEAQDVVHIPDNTRPSHEDTHAQARFESDKAEALRMAKANGQA